MQRQRRGGRPLLGGAITACLAAVICTTSGLAANPPARFSLIAPHTIVTDFGRPVTFTLRATAQGSASIHIGGLLLPQGATLSGKDGNPAEAVLRWRPSRSGVFIATFTAQSVRSHEGIAEHGDHPGAHGAGRRQQRERHVVLGLSAGATPARSAPSPGRSGRGPAHDSNPRGHPEPRPRSLQAHGSRRPDVVSRPAARPAERQHRLDTRRGRSVRFTRSTRTWSSTGSDSSRRSIATGSPSSTRRSGSGKTATPRPQATSTSATSCAATGTRSTGRSHTARAPGPAFSPSGPPAATSASTVRTSPTSFPGGSHTAASASRTPPCSRFIGSCRSARPSPSGDTPHGRGWREQPKAAPATRHGVLRANRE